MTQPLTIRADTPREAPRESLKPCPFCGGTELSHGYDSPPLKGSVQCHDCDAFVVADDEAEAITAWNTRARPEPSEAVVAEAMLAELRRQAKETRGNPFLYDENGLTDTTIDGEVDLIALARAAISGVL
jgi:Lar family restriction alleviation protein